MKLNTIEILIPRQEKRNDTQAFEVLNERIKDLFISVPAKKKIQNIWMELYQNMMKFRSSDHLSLFKLEIDNLGLITLISMNYSRKINIETLQNKWNALQLSNDLKTDFQTKIQRKMINRTEKPGDFGLDFCFRYSKLRSFHRIARPDSQEIVYLAFSFPSYG